jgi:hypothetical protein
VCVKFQVTILRKSNRREPNRKYARAALPRGARLHVTYGSMAGEATANLLHVLLWDILVSEPE